MRTLYLPPNRGKLPPEFPRVLIVFSCTAALLLTACGKSGNASPPTPAPPPPAATSSAQQGPVKAQPKLPTIKLYVGTNEITAEIARTPRQIETGMMFRTQLGEMEGMIFVFPRPEYRSFWMKNCPLPMSCAYIAPDGEILEVRKMVPHETKGILSKTSNVQFVLEMNRDWFSRHGVSSGAVISTEHGSMLETFFNR